jgi:hypothetical protein
MNTYKIPAQSVIDWAGLLKLKQENNSRFLKKFILLHIHIQVLQSQFGLLHW